MPIILPKLNKRFLEGIIACARIDTGSHVFDDLLENDRYSRITSYVTSKTSEITAFVHIDKSENGEHFHLEAYKNRKARGRSSSITEIPLDEFQKLIDRSIGNKVSVDISCGFKVPLAKLPENGLIRGNAVELRKGDVSFQTSAAEVTIRGIFVDRVKWWLIDNGKNARVNLETCIEGNIDNDYLVDLITYLYDDFKMLILTPNDESEPEDD